MRKEFDEQLCKEFPKIFRDRRGNMMQTAMCWGFDCDDGWFQLLRELCLKLQKYADKMGPEYQPIATQVKEKYGTLRFYVMAGDEFIWKCIDEADAISAKTCEVCGNEGKLRGYGWVKTLCDKHRDELEYEDFEEKEE